jgi:DnaA family protein
MQQLLLALAPPPSPTLENFFPGRNSAALGALRAALAGGEAFVYLWGAAGSGKTHLLQGFARVAGVDAAYFLAEGADWTRAERLRAIAVDEVSRLGQPGQVALFDLCNRLRACGGALAATGTVPPAELALRPDLRSRLASGIVLQLHPLGDAEKAQALRQHAAARGLALDEALVSYLLTHFERDMGTQIALLDALDRYSLQRQRGITLPLLKEVLQQMRSAQ